jgi:hypothetical protein
MENIKSVVIQKDVKTVTKNLTKDTLISAMCKKSNVSELNVRRRLMEAGVNA